MWPRLRGNREITRVWRGQQELAPCVPELGSYPQGYGMKGFMEGFAWEMTE